VFEIEGTVIRDPHTGVPVVVPERSLSETDSELAPDA
jgi:hypothetical protein